MGKIYISLAAILLWTGIAYPQDTLTWEECVREAKKNHPDLISSYEKVKQAEEDRAIEISSAFLQVEAAASGKSAEASTGATTDTYLYSVTGEQLIFDGFKTLHDIASSSKTLQAEEYNYMVASSDIRLDLRGAFVSLLKAQGLILLTEEIAERRMQNLKLVKLRYEAGREHKGSLLTADANLADAEYEVKQAERSIALYQRQLSKEMGLQKLNPIKVEGEFFVAKDYDVKPDIENLADTIPEIGRWFTRDEISRRDKVVIVGPTVVDKLFGNVNPVGETVKINRINFRIIGLAPAKGAGGWHDQDDIIYIPVTTAMFRVLGKDYFDGIYAEISEVESTDKAQEKIGLLIANRHRIFKDPEDYFHIRDMSEIQEMLSNTTRTMSMLLGCIAAISLLVGGIGIMNIMLVSVTERTREIGLRKAIGARAKDVMTQFLIESVVMTLSGGLIGILLGILTSIMLSYLAGWATKVTIFNIILAASFSIAVGMFFGLWPAKKASELNPIEALRYE